MWLIDLFKKQPQVRTRFAPSPTGFLHIGSLRTVLYVYIFAKQNKGKFVLRIEDTDQSRQIEGAVENLIKSLNWAGLEPDEGIIYNDNGKLVEKGNFGPYTQSHRAKIYQEYAKKLVKEGNAYHCFCSQDRLDNLRQQQQQDKLPTKYDWHCRSLSSQEVEEKLNRGDKYVIRLKVPQSQEIIFYDWVRGEVKFDSKEIDDQVILKSDGLPTYHLASVVDDHQMKISHVIRGEEWLSSTPKHILLYMFLGWNSPEFIHLPLILNKDKTKLSKRQGDVAVEDYINKGYLPEALINFVALLGWNPGTDQEIFSIGELFQIFDLKKVHKSGAIFDHDKLDWINSEYIKAMTLERFGELSKPFIKTKFPKIKNMPLKVLELEKNRVNTLAEVGDNVGFFFADELKYDPKTLIWKKSDQATTIKDLGLLVTELEKYETGDWTSSNLEKNIIKFIADSGLKNGDVLWPMRVALTGEQKSPPPFEVAAILGQDKSLSRIKQAIDLLK
ncbi:MAG TPA: glutamate--tRNA ligase [Patescibacteria group bacterium]|nr:glutamate--tRNA ligase [Patescibacteria group bacterium]